MQLRGLRLGALVCFIVAGVPWWLYHLQIVIDQDVMPWLVALYVPTFAAGLICTYVLGWRFVFRVTHGWFKHGLFLIPWINRGVILLALLTGELYCFFMGWLSMSYVVNCLPVRFATG